MFGGLLRGTASFAAGAAALALCTSVAAAPPPDAAAERGLDSMRSRGCLACHTVDGSPQIGPTFVGLFGSVRSVRTDGALRQVTVDPGYVARSLENPEADLVQGYPSKLMPSFELKQGELDDVVAALRHLSVEPAPKPRGSMLSLAIAAALFVALHLFMSSLPIRRRVVAKIGLGAFQGVYSLVIVGVFSWMIYAWSKAPFVPLWSSPAWTRLVPLVGMLPIFVLMVAGYSTKNPTTAGQEAALGKAEAATGILRVTRHPVNLSNALWGFVHLPPNGDLASVLLFGSITLLAILGTLHIERRRRETHGEDWEKFASATSIVPFVAILEGRNRLSVSEIGAWRLLLGVVTYALALAAHTYAIGASPYPL